MTVTSQFNLTRMGGITRRFAFIGRAILFKFSVVGILHNPGAVCKNSFKIKREQKFHKSRACSARMLSRYLKHITVSNRTPWKFSSFKRYVVEVL